jgi:hypothetical protein
MPWPLISGLKCSRPFPWLSNAATSSPLSTFRKVTLQQVFDVSKPYIFVIVRYTQRKQNLSDGTRF